MRFLNFFSVAAVPALAVAGISSFSDDEYSLVSRMEDAGLNIEFFARGIYEDDEDIFDLAVRDFEEDIFDLAARDLEDEEILDLLLARGPIYGDDSKNYQATVGKGEIKHNGPGILKTTEYSVQRDPPPKVPNFSYPKSHSKGPYNRRSLSRRGPIYGDDSKNYQATVGKGDIKYSGPGILKTTEYSVQREQPKVPNFSYPKGHNKNP